MPRMEDGADQESVDQAISWLNAKPAGSTLAEFLLRLPALEAERISKAVQDLRRLKLDEQRHGNEAGQINLWAWIGGAIGLFLILPNLSGRPLPLLTDIAFVLAVWWLASRAIDRAFSNAGRAASARLQIHDDVFKPIGIQFDEDKERVYSLTRLVEAEQHLNKQLDAHRQAFAEILKGESIAKAKGVSPLLFEHRQHRLGTVLGGFSTEELLEHPDCEKLFREMCRLGLSEHTVEAILLCHPQTHRLLTSRTIEIATARIASLNRRDRSGHEPL